MGDHDNKPLSPEELTRLLRQAAKAPTRELPQEDPDAAKVCFLCGQEIADGEDYRTGLTKDQTARRYAHTVCLDSGIIPPTEIMDDQR